MYINDSNIGPIGCVALFDALINNASLEDLDMNNNSIDEKGTYAIAASIAHNKTLKQLHNDNNNLLKNSQIVKKGAAHAKKAAWKSCEIKGGGPEVAVVVW